MKLRQFAQMAIFAVFGFGAVSAGADYDWIGATSSNTSVKGNWSGNTVPTKNDTVRFIPTAVAPTATVNQPTVDNNLTVAALTIGPTKELGNWTFSAGTPGVTALSIRGGALTSYGPGTYTFDGPLLQGDSGGNQLSFNLTSGSNLKLAGETTAITDVSGLTLGAGTLTLDNTGTNKSDRLAAAGITSLGGRIEFLGNAAGSTETVGALTLSSGATTIRVTAHPSATGATDLKFTNTGSLRSSTAMTVNFVGVNGTLGAAGVNPRVSFTGTPFTGTNTGMLSNTSGSDTTIGWATVGGTEWAGLGGNGIVALAPDITSGTNTVIQAATATDLVLFNPVSSQTLDGAVTSATFKITPGASALNLNIGTHNLSTFAMMLAGSTDFTITGTTGRVMTGGSTRYVYVSEADTVLTFDGVAFANGQPVTKSGAGTLALVDKVGGATNLLPFTSNQSINIVQGTLRGTLAALGGGTSSDGDFTNLNLYGGVLEISGGGTFSRALTTNNGSGSGGALKWTGSTSARGDGGFSAIGGNATVTLVTAIGGATAASPTWGSGAFVADGYALVFGSTKSDSRITLTNNFALDGVAGAYQLREIRVIDNPNHSGDYARLTGQITGSSTTDLIKTGAGTLELTSLNTYQGNTLVQAGTLLVGGSLGDPNGTRTGSVVIGSGAAVGGSGTIAQNDAGSAGVFVRNGGAITAGTDATFSKMTLLLGTSGLDFDTNSTYQVKLFGTGADDISLLDVQAGNVTIASGAKIALDLSALTPAQVQALSDAVGIGNTRVYTVITGGGTVGNFTAANFSISNLGNFAGGQWALVASPDAGTVQVAYSPVPEPATVLGIAAAALGLGGVVRRVRRD